MLQFFKYQGFYGSAELFLFWA